ncbi:MULTISPECIES: 3-hydroxyacyl-ACP dehydratase [Maribacter]|uniref:3-hydroxyacyl-ACP dehydratase n=1 Tax=Maribacter flavus TaxID=1658664 RepID=A0A5B2TWV0_9FLAO|nr:MULTISPECIES: 3-hydroxyacyl-ACP dehydratase [Maribacter]KAA2218937.1 3-hydroxyacyl-ACP dehydratase [Maribacter flavus]MDC6403888.1 3-hydroxyacyl-ACP dehydratase [Maribacter sp. PR66]MEE1971029.1 3-hydroxyacyl-ACP dehydratase [Maribacter flavus]
MLLEGLYEIQEFNYMEPYVKATVKLNKDHEIFEGHFPGHPVLPGVCVIQIIKELTEKSIEKKLLLSVASNVKFMAVINPEKNDTVEFEIELSQSDDEVKIKNTVSFEDTMALKLNASFKITA